MEKTHRVVQEEMVLLVQLLVHEHTIRLGNFLFSIPRFVVNRSCALSKKGTYVQEEIMDQEGGARINKQVTSVCNIRATHEKGHTHHDHGKKEGRDMIRTANRVVKSARPGETHTDVQHSAVYCTDKVKKSAQYREERL